MHSLPVSSRGFRSGADQGHSHRVGKLRKHRPPEAALVANTLIKNYIESNFRAKYDATRQATGWMEQRLDELKVKVEKSQEAMVSYERQNNIVNLGEKQTVTEQRFET